MRSGYIAVTHCSNGFTLGDLLAFLYINLAQMRIYCGVTIAVVHHYHVAIAWGSTRVEHIAAAQRKYRGSIVICEVDAIVHYGVTRNRVRSVAKSPMSAAHMSGRNRVCCPSNPVDR